MDSFISPLPCPAVYVLMDGQKWTQGLSAFQHQVNQLIAGGAALIQFRDKSLTDRQHIVIGQHLSQWTRSTPTRWIMNDRVDLAMAAGADGVHLGQDDMPIEMARKIIGHDKLIGVSTHSVQQAQQAESEGADYIGVGPVFESQTKTFQRFVGVSLVREVAESVSISAFAIGGITPDNVAQIRDAGMQRVAVAGVVAKAEHPDVVIGQLLKGLS